VAVTVPAGKVRDKPATPARDTFSMTPSATPTTPLTTLEFMRRLRGLFRPELARQSGVSIRTILAIEREERVPQLVPPGAWRVRWMWTSALYSPEGEPKHV
jgi:hypothetical protein